LGEGWLCPVLQASGERHLYVTEYIIHKFWQWKHIILARTGADVRGDSGTTYASKSTIYQVKKVKLI
jgi:hypothetical protein